MIKNCHKKVLAAALFLCCSPVDGKDPYALWETFTHPDGIYRFSYLSPPWKKLSTSNTSTQQFVVDRDGVPLENVGLPGDGVEARLSMEVELFFRMSAPEAASAHLKTWGENGARGDPSEVFESHGGAKGLRIWARASDRFITAVYHDLPGGDSVSMIVVGKDEVSSSDIVLLLESLEPSSEATRGIGF